MVNTPLTKTRATELQELLEENMWKLLAYTYYRTKQITLSEFEYLVQDFSKSFPPPSWLTQQEEQETSTMSGVIVQQETGKNVDEKFLDIAMGTMDGYMGYAFVDEGEIDYGEMSLDNKAEVKENIATTPNDKPIVLFYSKALDTSESHQPFVTLTKENGKPACVCFIEGDTKASQFENQSHSKEFCYHQEIVAPKLVEMLGLFNDDMDKLYEYLSKGVTKTEMLSTAFPGTLAKGEILIMFANGKTVSMVKGDNHKKYEWGETSRALGYEGKALDAPVKKGLGNNKASVPPTGSGSQTSKKDPGKPATAMAAAIAKAEDNKTNLDIKIVAPAHKFQSKASLEGWYRGFGDPNDQPSAEEINEMVGNAHKAIPIKIKPTLSNKAFNDLLSKGLILLAPDTSKPKVENKKVEVTVPAIIVPKQELEKLATLKDKIAKAKTDTSSGLIFDPKLIQEKFDSKKLLSATDQLGFQSLDEFEGNYEMWDEYIKTPTAVKAILVQYMMERWKGKRALDEALKLKKAM